MSTPLTGERSFRNEAVRLADLTVAEPVIRGYNFSNCRIIGPAVLVLQDSAVIASGWDAPDLDAVFWEVPPQRAYVVGAVLAVDCTFSNCTFEAVGIAGPPEMRATLEQGFQS